MEQSRLPMRGKTKDAEAEALLKLLRQEQEFHNQVSIPEIQRKQPLPAIRSKASDSITEEHEGSGVFISQMRTTKDRDQEIPLNVDSQFLWNARGSLNRNNNDSHFTVASRPAYEWKKDSSNVNYSKFERQRRPSKNLPPLGPQQTSPRDRGERPSRPPPSSPKFWEDEKNEGRF
ncbi:uncharacterized protein LOC116299641 [Actinia tenebrosa]|uniref:Uncharacterized protein LOC116299641 n=1 Tax=Actinia tenebrosa TaxID=6105 RepID=A0A6P8IEE7_ACTTE|nr:uncharacterized protein LOC116299641 [Actinia tenebrosa]